MSPDPNDGGTTAIINGVVDIKVNCNRANEVTNISNAVMAKIGSVFGVSSSKSLANHVMYCLPDGVIGYTHAYINSWNSIFNGNFCNKVSYLEFGLAVRPCKTSM
jgi:hypothetical protein